MKRYFLIICIAIFAVVSAKAQDTLLVNSKATVKGAPYLINYQAIAKDAAGNILANTDIGTTFRIYNSANQVVYAETGPKVKTNASGMLTYKIGTVAGSADKLAAIDWAADTYMLDITLRIGATAVWMGRTSIVSVPYAFYANKANVAKTAENVINYTAGEGIAIENNTIKNTKPAQTLSLKGDTLFISGGNFVVIPGISCLQPCNNDTTVTNDSVWLTTDPRSNYQTVDIFLSGTKNKKISVDWGDNKSKSNEFVFSGSVQHLIYKYDKIDSYKIVIKGDINEIDTFGFWSGVSEFDTVCGFVEVNTDKMINVRALHLHGENLKNIMLDYNTELTNIGISSRVINSLNLKNNQKVKYIGIGYAVKNVEYIPEKIDDFYIVDSDIKDFKFLSNTYVKNLHIEHCNNLEFLNFNNFKIKRLLVQTCFSLDSIYLTNISYLDTLFIHKNNNLLKIDFTNSHDLRVLSVEDNVKLENIVFLNNNKIDMILARYCNLSQNTLDHIVMSMANGLGCYMRKGVITAKPDYSGAHFSMEGLKYRRILVDNGWNINFVK